MLLEGAGEVVDGFQVGQEWEVMWTGQCRCNRLLLQIRFCRVQCQACWGKIRTGTSKLSLCPFSFNNSGKSKFTHSYNSSLNGCLKDNLIISGTSGNQQHISNRSCQNQMVSPRLHLNSRVLAGLRWHHQVKLAQLPNRFQRTAQHKITVTQLQLAHRPLLGAVLMAHPRVKQRCSNNLLWGLIHRHQLQSHQAQHKGHVHQCQTLRILQTMG